MTGHRHLIPEPIDGFHPTVGLALWFLEDARERTIRLLDRLPDEAADWRAPWGPNRIGSLVYHLAVIELDWLYAEILEDEPAAEFRRLFPHDARTDDGVLSRVVGDSFDTHLARLHAVRSRFTHALRDMDGHEFARVRRLDEYDVSPAWVIHHLCQHEAEHRGQIGEIAASGGFLSQGS